MTQAPYPALPGQRRAHSFFPILLLLGWAVCGWLACGPPTPTTSVVLVVLDTARADRFGCYGREGAQTPCLDRLAERGLLFEKAFTPVPITLPSHASILTGTYPTFHGVRDNSPFKLAESMTTLAEVLAEQGFRTGGFIGGFPIHSQFGLAQGFELYDDNLQLRQGEIAAKLEAERPGEQVVAATVAWLDKLDADEPFFAFVQLFDPHTPYKAPPEFAERFPGDPYQAEIAYTDACLGNLLDYLQQSGREESTLVIVVADHGEGLGDHGEETHAFLLYQPTMRVPLILAGPGIEPSGRIPGPVSTIDIMPTLLDLLNVPVPAEVQGRSLVETFSASKPTHPPILLETEFPKLRRGWSELTGIVDGDFKLIRAPSAREQVTELYDLSRDPEERNDIAASEPERLAHLLSRLEREQRSHQGKARDTIHAPSDAAMENLRQLGYLGGGAQIPSGGRAAHPALMMPLLQELGQVKARVAQQRFAEALQLLDGLEERFPGEVGIPYNRGLCFLERSRKEPTYRAKAIEQLELVLQKQPNHEMATKLLRGLRNKYR